MAGAGDIVAALEGAYPLIWQYYELHTSEARQQERAHKSVHRLWDQLTQTAKSNVSLNQELGEAGRHTDQLVLALERAESDKRGLRESLEQVGEALKGAGQEIEALREQKAMQSESFQKEKTGLLRSVEEIGDALKRADQINRDLTAANEAYVKQNADLAHNLAVFPVRYAVRFRRLAGRIRRKLGL
jgi:chromosome segregation ATPase